MTCFGTCVPAGPSRNAATRPFTCNCSEGNCSLTQATSNALLSVPCTTGVLMVCFPSRNSLTRTNQSLIGIAGFVQGKLESLAPTTSAFCQFGNGFLYLGNPDTPICIPSRDSIISSAFTHADWRRL